jgi:Domain of unknown function (DUF4189)
MRLNYRISLIKTNILLLLVVALMNVSYGAHAEGGCPPGYYPTTPPGQQGPQGCAPIPNENEGTPQLGGPRWVSRFGAIATDSTVGSLGVAAGLPSRRKAEKTALTDCEAKGGANCKIETWYRNRCAAMVIGEKVHSVNNADTLKEAIQLGMNTCGAADTNCHVFYSACSPPEQIQ